MDTTHPMHTITADQLNDTHIGLLAKIDVAGTTYTGIISDLIVIQGQVPTVEIINGEPVATRYQITLYRLWVAGANIVLAQNAPLEVEEQPTNQPAHVKHIAGYVIAALAAMNFILWSVVALRSEVLFLEVIGAFALALGAMIIFRLLTTYSQPGRWAL